MKNRIFNKISLLALGLFVITFLTACADLTGIRQFSEVSADSASYTALSKDYVQSSERQKRFQDKTHGQELDKNSEERKKQLPIILSLHKGVQEYMLAIGALASDELVSYDKELDSLSNDIKAVKLPHLDDNSINAFSALTKLIAKAATDAYRQRQLNQIIGEANDDFQILINAMSDIVGLDYVSSLKNEEVTMDKLYKKVELESENSKSQQASIQLLKESRDAKQDAIEAKMKSCKLYAEMLKTIGAGHKLLYDNRENLSAEQFLGTLHGYRKEIETLNNAIQELK